ncbi:DNA-binding transcription repressor [Tieghemiomyces parasiticus]|uniref:DNA-binding transcription repressor n=1 Tax=Tieghemiomyces parasiticus TaxID=78921 RepID=A0A9W8A5R9_9FUNG|nr:DNA-binding transcription repressor [Tieghemiomyces parasiticus]
MAAILRPPHTHRRKGIPTRSPRKDDSVTSLGVTFQFPLLPGDLSSFETFTGEGAAPSPWLLAGSWPVRSAGLAIPSPRHNTPGRSVSATTSPVVSAKAKPAGAKRAASTEPSLSQPKTKRPTPSTTGTTAPRKPSSNSVTGRDSPRVRPRTNRSPVRHSSRRTLQNQLTEVANVEPAAPEPAAAATDSLLLATPNLNSPGSDLASVDEPLSLADEVATPPPAHIDIDNHPSSAATDDSVSVTSPSSPSESTRKLSGRRACISCSNSNTPCWRPGWDNSISLCNSCGLRFKKSKIFCKQCRYVPLKSEIQSGPKHTCSKCHFEGDKAL